jgi:hypothetical protein
MAWWEQRRRRGLTPVPAKIPPRKASMLAELAGKNQPGSTLWKRD